MTTIKNLDAITAVSSDDAVPVEQGTGGSAKTRRYSAEQLGLTSGATGARPTALFVGQQFFDTTLGKPVFWDGTNWVDGVGTIS